MENSVSKVLIETVVKKTLRDMKDDPDRSIRNLVDRALLVSGGRFQKRFFQSAQSMLHNEQSAYYALVRNAVENIDHDRLLRFGMNIGYNSCTTGAKKIREIEAREGSNIPWAMFLEIDAGDFARQRQRYAALVEEGGEMGVYTWFLRVNGFSCDMFQWIERYPDCAFGLLCAPEDVSDALIGEAERLNNLMVGVGLGAQTGEVCEALRARKMLYCIYCQYGENRLREILSGDLLHDTQAMNAPFTVFLPEGGCGEAARARVFGYTQRVRKEQRFPTIAWELFEDSMAVDTIISGDGCSAGFRADGAFFALADHRKGQEMTLWEHSLREILQACLPKSTA